MKRSKFESLVVNAIVRKLREGDTHLTQSDIGFVITESISEVINATCIDLKSTAKLWLAISVAEPSEACCDEDETHSIFSSMKDAIFESAVSDTVVTYSGAFYVFYRGNLFLNREEKEGVIATLRETLNPARSWAVYLQKREDGFKRPVFR